MEIQPRELDGVTRRVFERYARRQYAGDMAANRERAMQLRAGLESLGFEFQTDEDGRVYPVFPALAPCDRDALAHYLGAYHVPYRIIWGNPWAKTFHGSDFQSRFPNAALVSDRILQFEVGAMNEEDVEFAIEKIRTFLAEFDS
jgi:dTDP-4-amino-4,6-dideoxygalactose transaminase